MKVQRINPSAKMREYREKDCRCPRHASHSGCAHDSFRTGILCICAPSAVTMEGYTPQPPPRTYFEETFARQLAGAKQTGRRAF